MTTSPVRFAVRDATECDGARLLELMSGSAAAGGVRWAIEPANDPFASLRAERDGWTVALAEDDRGRLLGFVSVASRTVFAPGRPLRSCYVTNLKVLPEYRGRGIGDALCWHAVELCRRSGGDSVPILVVIRTGNSKMRGRLSGPRGLPKLTKVADVEVHSVDTRHAATVALDGELHVRAARAADLEEMAELSNCVAGERQFSPAFDADGLARWIDAAPGLTLSDYMIARSGDRIVGWIGWWDEIAVRVVRISGYTMAGNVRCAIQRVAALVLGGRPPSGVGDHVGCVRAVHACVPSNRPDVLTSLVAEGARRRAPNCSWLKIALDVRDPLVRALRVFRTRVTAFDARLTSPSGGDHLLPFGDRPLHLDAALI